MTGQRARGTSAIFSPARLRLARQAAGLRKGQLAQRVEVTPASIGQYENGVTRPSPAVLARIALTLDVPVEFFGDDGRPLANTDASQAFFRSLRSTRLLERERALARAALVWEVFEAFERRVRFPAVEIPTDLAVAGQLPVAEIEKRATLLRETWGLGKAPIPNVVRLLESKGVIVSRLTTDTKRVSAFSKWFGARPLVVLSNAMDDKGRSRFDAAHELGHLVMHPDPEPGSHLLEHQAQTFAAAFLMPAEAIRAVLPRRPDWAQLLELKGIWGVSIQALLYRARTLGVLTEGAYRRAMTALSGFGWRTNEPGALGAPERPVLLHRALGLLQEGGFSLETVAMETHLPAAFVLEIIHGDPPSPAVSLDGP